LSDGRAAGRLGLAIMITFTGVTHFSNIRYDYAEMVPPPLTGQMWVIYLTGLMQVAGAAGLWLPQTRRLAGICLFLLLLALFPGNVYAVMQGVQFRGAPPTNLWLRGLIQAVFLMTVWWSAISRPGRPRDAANSHTVALAP
jgi:uncharacterized membrane protein